MNYRHAYHAGNFADVLKHAVFASIIAYLQRKPAPFRVIDTHGGAGRYRLTSHASATTREWQGGIARLLGPAAKPLPAGAASFLSPYLTAVRAENTGSTLEVYPGSPCIALNLLRPQDRLIANELYPDELAQLRVAIGRDPRAKVMALDGFIALKALLPPKERRGVVLIDPPFEEPKELERVADGLRRALQRFATGIFIAWYPIKDIKPINRFHSSLAALDVALLRVELLLERTPSGERLNGCGLVIANPPFTLKAALAAVLPELSRRLAVQGAGRYRLDWIKGSGGQPSSGPNPGPNSGPNSGPA
jgi:23S rRNA (adenine2030-N6)-methyltransferase